MEEYQQDTQRVVRISKKKFVVWIIFLVIVLGVGWFFVRPFFYYGISVEESGVISVPSMQSLGGSAPSAPEKAFISDDIYPYPYPRPGTPDITDTREFLKTDYSAQIETRDVPEVVERVEDFVHRVDGRVDNISSSEKFGRISFVIPKSKLSEFRDDIEELVHEKLYVETITSTNLLGEKQNIEERTEKTIKSLAELEKEKADSDAAHAARLSSLQASINSVQSQLNAVRAEKGELEEEDEDYEANLQKLNNQEASLTQQMNNLLSQRTEENRGYARENNRLVNLINQAGGNLELLAEEDADFMDNIETVNGYVNVRWINLWTLAERFTPTPMWLNTLVVVILIIWYLKRRRVFPKVEIV